jgi:hypothetical protein
MRDISQAASNQSQLVRGAWLTVILLLPVALLNYLDRQLLAAINCNGCQLGIHVGAIQMGLCTFVSLGWFAC